MDKAEIQRELDHVNKVLKIAHDNRCALEQQQIQQGMIAPLNLINQMNEIKSAIQELEERKNNLEIQSVEEDYSLAEAEYRVIVAEVWQEGYLSTVGKSQLEMSRLRLKIDNNRSSEIEREVRSGIVDDIFFEEEIRIIWAPSPSRDFLRHIVKAIRLDYKRLVVTIINDKLNKNDSPSITDQDLQTILARISNTSSLRGNEKKTIVEEFNRLLKEKLQECKLYLDQ